jgi:hypothetical protein
MTLHSLPLILVLDADARMGRRMTTLLHAAYGRTFAYRTVDSPQRAMTALTEARRQGQVPRLFIASVNERSDEYSLFVRYLADKVPSLSRLLVSDSWETESVNELAKSVGAIGVLPKPWRVSEVVRFVSQLLPVSPLRQTA